MPLDFSKSKTTTLTNAIRKTEDANAKLIKNVPVGSIVETPENEYVFGILDSDVDRLAEEIQNHGFESAITVIDLHNGTYQVISGHQRLRAVKKLGRKTIPCIVDDDLNEEEKYRKLLTSNVLNRKITPVGMARAINLYEEKVLTKEEIQKISAVYPELQNNKRKVIARFFNISAGQVYRYQAITKMPEEIQEMCKDPDFPWTGLEYAASFNDEQKQELLAFIKDYNAHKAEGTSISKNTLNQWIDQIKNKKDSKDLGNKFSKDVESTYPNQTATNEQLTSSDTEYGSKTMNKNDVNAFGVNEPSNIDIATESFGIEEQKSNYSGVEFIGSHDRENFSNTSKGENVEDSFSTYSEAIEDSSDYVSPHDENISRENALNAMKEAAEYPITDSNRNAMMHFVKECEIILSGIKKSL